MKCGNQISSINRQTSYVYLKWCVWIFICTIRNNVRYRRNNIILPIFIFHRWEWGFISNGIFNLATIQWPFVKISFETSISASKILLYSIKKCIVADCLVGLPHLNLHLQAAAASALCIYKYLLKYKPINAYTFVILRICPFLLSVTNTTINYLMYI